jgi:hypothetical protein
LHDANDFEEGTELVRQSQSWSQNFDRPRLLFDYCFYYSNRWLTRVGPSSSSRTNELLLRLHRQRPPSSVGSCSTLRTNGDEIITGSFLVGQFIGSRRSLWKTNAAPDRTHQVELSQKVANLVRMRLKMERASTTKQNVLNDRQKCLSISESRLTFPPL